MWCLSCCLLFFCNSVCLFDFFLSVSTFLRIHTSKGHEIWEADRSSYVGEIGLSPFREKFPLAKNCTQFLCGSLICLVLIVTVLDFSNLFGYVHHKASFSQNWWHKLVNFTQVLTHWLWFSGFDIKVFSQVLQIVRVKFIKFLVEVSVRIKFFSIKFNFYTNLSSQLQHLTSYFFSWSNFFEV